MKYCQFLKALDGLAVGEFRGEFLNYKRLKKLLKHAAQEGTDAQFLEFLERDLRRVNRVFLDATERVLQCAGSGFGAVLARLVSCSGAVQRNAGKMGASLLRRKKQKKMQLVHAHWCRQYAAVNSIALRKICKKHDKVCRNMAGQHFLQVCWQGQDVSLGTILHSPLLQELLALEQHLSTALKCPCPCPCPDPELCTNGADCPGRKPQPAEGHLTSRVRASSSSCGSSRTTTGGGQPAVNLQNLDINCCICLSPLFRPIGLLCGHRFCRACFLASARLQYHLGPLHAILADAKASGACCPQCRQQGVARSVMRLTYLGQLSKEREPAAWSARKQEEREWRQTLLRELECGNPRRLPIVEHVEFNCCGSNRKRVV